MTLFPHHQEVKVTARFFFLRGFPNRPIPLLISHAMPRSLLPSEASGESTYSVHHLTKTAR